jgi:hypothetical protein
MTLQLDPNDPLLPENLSARYQDFVYEKSHWAVGDNQFSNKLMAIQESVDTGTRLNFVPDARWKEVDFSKQPSDSLFDLFNERAAQIRRDYDYVRLMMGAGWDTHTVLRSFYNTSSKIDEIVINRKFIKSPEDLCCFEETHVVAKTLEHYRDFLKDTKITVIDSDWRHWQQRYSNPTHLRYSHSTQIEFHGGLLDFCPYWYYPDMLKLFDQGIRAVNVIGTEKPRFVKACGRWFYVLSDMDFKIQCPGHLDFFRDPGHPSIAIKESHIMMQQKIDDVELFEAIKQIRFPIPEGSFNNMVHQYPSKYFPARRGQENNKGVAMAMIASIHPETRDLFGKWVDSIQYWINKYPEWFPQAWIPGKWIRPSYGYCFPLDAGDHSTAIPYHKVKAMHEKMLPGVPMSDDIHVTSSSR